MPILKPALSSEEEAFMVRLAKECARTLRAYEQAEANGGETWKEWRARCNRAWSEHEVALFNYENAFPDGDDWQRIAEQERMEVRLC